MPFGGLDNLCYYVKTKTVEQLEFRQTGYKIIKKVKKRMKKIVFFFHIVSV